MPASSRGGILLRRSLGLFVLAGGLSFGCQNAQEPIPVASLRQSGRAAFLCRDEAGQGVPMSFCELAPDLDTGGAIVARNGYALHALVTQTVTAEVAIVQLTGADENGESAAVAIDLDPSSPGVTPLRVGQKPEDIVVSPGGLASFVGVREPEKPGIFALPTVCLSPPEAGEPIRDLTSWPACSLPSAPGDMVMLVHGDAMAIDGSSGGVEGNGGASSGRGECFADLSIETADPGQRKLVVGLPDEGKIVVIDAQSILDGEPGAYPACPIEAEISLLSEVPDAVPQAMPSDLQANGCFSEEISYGPFPTPLTARPSGMALTDRLLVVADQGTPLVHRIDLTDPGNPVELPPLVATSFLSPERVVTTSKVAVSPETSEGERFVYALDEVGEDAASLMVFRMGDEPAQRTPLLRSGSAEMLLEPPDRISFAAPIQDIGFAELDEPEVDPETETGATRVRCNPDPRASSADPGVLYRPEPDGSQGADPSVFRGVFAYALLSNGRLVTIDVDDWDAPCRRPVSTNASSTLDFRGCSDDASAFDYFTTDGTSESDPTVTGEVSCRAVVPHRARSSRLVTTNESVGTQAPSLSSFPRLTLAGRGLPVSRKTVEGRKHPILLGVDFAGPNGPEPAQVFVGSNLRVSGDPELPLPVDPRVAEQNSLVLPLIEPRAYPGEEIVTVTYEGDLSGVHSSGKMVDLDSGLSLEDSEVSFCDLGAQGEVLAEALGSERFGLTGAARSRFGRDYSDYVQIVTPLLDRKHGYWAQATEPSGCFAEKYAGRDDLPEDADQAYEYCDAFFGDGVGSSENDDLLPARDFRIQRSLSSRLELTPRDEESVDEAIVGRALACCFPLPISYRIRAGRQWIVKGQITGYRHPVQAGDALPDEPDLRVCERSCSPLRLADEGRAFELSSNNCDDPRPELDDGCGVGPRTDDDLVCAYDSEQGPVSLGGAAESCIHSGLTRRFAIYRGLEPSVRGMNFGFEVIGGFSVQSISFSEANATDVLPVSLEMLPELGRLGVVDARSRGFLFVDLRDSRISSTVR